MERKRRIAAVLSALLAAVFYAINTPISKRLLNGVAPTLMAAFLYLGAGLGVGIMYVFRFKKEDASERLTKADLPYTVGMIVLDIAAPIFLMLGIKNGTASNASLLGNFEIAATALIALLLFHEKVSALLWIAIGFITVSGIVLSLEGASGFRFSSGSLLVLLATCCWGLENNCTGKISGKSTYEIVVLKGVFSGGDYQPEEDFLGRGRRLDYQPAFGHFLCRRPCRDDYDGRFGLEARLDRCEEQLD